MATTTVVYSIAPLARRISTIDATVASFVFEVTGGRDKIDKFVELMGELGLVEVARTGIVAIARGKDAA